MFGFIAAKKAEHSIKTMCRVLEVSRSGYHAWARRASRRRERVEDERLTGAHPRDPRENREVYGSPRIHAELRARRRRADRRASASSG